MRRAVSTLLELREPMGEYLARSWHYWRLICVVGVVGLVGIALTVAPVLEAVIPLWGWILIGLLGIPVAQFLAFREVRWQRDSTIEELDKARLERDVLQNELTEIKASAERHAQVTFGPVTTFGQSGGQAAGVIQNIMGQQARKLPSDPTGIIAKLSPFAGAQVTMQFVAGDVESKRLAEGIHNMLVQAGWEPTDLQATMFGGAPEAVIVMGPGDTVETFSDALWTLGECLKSVGIHTVAQTADGELRVIVGGHPD